jgi:small-conductance mechanosensitive channel
VAKNITSLWGGVLALSFAFSGPVAELVNSCVWVFAKHTYDVGDLVEVMGKRLEVRQIYLTHTNFHEAVTGQTPIDGPVNRKVVQISHSSLSGEIIINWTRSADALADHILLGGRVHVGV